MKKLAMIILTLTLGLLLTGCSLSVDLFNEQVTLSFNEAGGSEIADMTVNKGTAFVPSEVPTKEGYVFDGWYLDEDYLYEASFSAGINNNLTVYAKWTDENAIYSLDDVRDIINDILDIDNITIADQSTIEGIVTDIISSGEYLSEQTIIDLVRDQIDVMSLFNAHVIDMLKSVSQSVVYIEATDNFSIATGSGVIFNHIGNEYYVLTNYHVIQGFNSFEIKVFDDTANRTISRFFVDLIETSITHDLAILKFTSNFDFETLPLGDVNDLEVGQLVFAIGSPLDLLNSSTMGIISAIDRPMTYQDENSDTNTTSIQHDAAISPGNSGGALVNIDGELVGVNFLSYVDEEVGEGVEGLHFAIQIDIVKSQLQSWGLLP